jgi:hypothetical protein
MIQHAWVQQGIMMGTENQKPLDPGYGWWYFNMSLGLPQWFDGADWRGISDKAAMDAKVASAITQYMQANPIVSSFDASVLASNWVAGTTVTDLYSATINIPAGTTYDYTKDSLDVQLKAVGDSESIQSFWIDVKKGSLTANKVTLIYKGSSAPSIDLSLRVTIIKG